MSSNQFQNSYKDCARQTLKEEAAAVLEAAERIGADFDTLINKLISLKGKIVVTGLGKSGHVARKISATLASTGTPSVYLHPTEALHGDFGVLSDDDCLIAIAYGGETKETVEVAKFALRLNITVVSITGKKDSSLAKLSDFIIDGSVTKEACPFNLAPTSSSTVALALGDALAVALMQARGFGQNDFAALHPGGSLGRRLSLVKDHMRTGSECPVLTADASFNEILHKVTNPNFGVVAIMSPGKTLVGCVTDGDLRRALVQYGKDAIDKTANDIMSHNPKTVLINNLAVDAFKKMEALKITSLFVLEDDNIKQPVGLVRMHDLLEAKIV